MLFFVLINILLTLANYHLDFQSPVGVAASFRPTIPYSLAVILI